MKFGRFQQFSLIPNRAASSRLAVPTYSNPAVNRPMLPAAAMLLACGRMSVTGVRVTRQSGERQRWRIRAGWLVVL